MKTYKAALIKPRLHTIKNTIKNRVQKQTQTDFHTWASLSMHTLPSDYFPVLVHQIHPGSLMPLWTSKRGRGWGTERKLGNMKDEAYLLTAT